MIKIPKKIVRDLLLSDVIGPLEPVRLNINMDKVRELAESIREKGQLVDALVRPCDSKYEIVWGDRRYLALKFLEALTIRAEIKELTDSETIILRATENLQREDLTPMEQARIYGQMRDRLQYTIESTARQMGKTHGTIKRYLDLLDLPEEFQNALDVGQIHIGVAEILIRIDDEDLRRYYLGNASQHGCSTKTAQLWVSDYEATKAAQYYTPSVGEGGIATFSPMKPTYYACDLCSEPVDISRAKHVLACPACVDKLRTKGVFQA